MAANRKWPEGYLCTGCFVKACETFGRCHRCAADRLVPGRDTHGNPLCADCAGVGDFTCRRCGQEGWRHQRGVCGRCVLAERLTKLLDDGAGIRPELMPLFEHVCRMTRPRSGILWLSKPHVPAILKALACGTVPLTHDGLSQLSPWRSVIHVRDLLIACGTLPPVDRFLLLFEQWLPAWLDSVRDPEHRKIFTRYANWQVLRRLRAAAGRGPIGSYRNNHARGELRTAADFLTRLNKSGQTLSQCTQADIDRWFAVTSSTRQQVRPFLQWCAEQRLTPDLDLPPAGSPARCPISQQQRLALIRRALTDPEMPDIDRVVALLVLLYAQRLNRTATSPIGEPPRTSSTA